LEGVVFVGGFLFGFVGCFFFFCLGFFFFFVFLFLGGCGVLWLGQGNDPSFPHHAGGPLEVLRYANGLINSSSFRSVHDRNSRAQKVRTQFAKNEVRASLPQWNCVKKQAATRGVGQRRPPYTEGGGGCTSERPRPNRDLLSGQHEREEDSRMLTKTCAGLRALSGKWTGRGLPTEEQPGDGETKRNENLHRARIRGTLGEGRGALGGVERRD